MIGGGRGAALGGIAGGLLGMLGGGQHGPLHLANWQMPDRKNKFNVSSNIGADIAVAMSTLV
jgi:hypothetical protein